MFSTEFYEISQKCLFQKPPMAYFKKIDNAGVSVNS